MLWLEEVIRIEEFEGMFKKYLIYIAYSCLGCILLNFRGYYLYYKSSFIFFCFIYRVLIEILFERVFIVKKENVKIIKNEIFKSYCFRIIWRVNRKYKWKNRWEK